MIESTGYSFGWLCGPDDKTSKLDIVSDKNSSFRFPMPETVLNNLIKELSLIDINDSNFINGNKIHTITYSILLYDNPVEIKISIYGNKDEDYPDNVLENIAVCINIGNDTYFNFLQSSSDLKQGIYYLEHRTHPWLYK